MSPSQSENLPWVEKYRPKQLDDLISHQDIISTSIHIKPPRYLFYSYYYFPMFS